MWSQALSALSGVTAQVKQKRGTDSGTEQGQPQQGGGMMGNLTNMLGGGGGGMMGNLTNMIGGGGGGMMSTLTNMMGSGVAGQLGQMIFGNNLEGKAWVDNQMKQQAFSLVDPNKAMSNANAQVTLLEPSPSGVNLAMLKAQNKVFEDTRFPPNDSSLSGEHGALPEWRSIQWKKISEFIKSPALIAGKIEPSDIQQGSLGDCYYLAGLAALAQRPDRIFNLFLTQQENGQHFYSVKILYKGKWVTIDMDEYIPCIGSSPAFTRANGNETWVLILEKAWAKLYTSYKRIEAGYPEEPLHDLTGAPIKQISVRNSPNPQRDWAYLLDASAREYSMLCSSNPGSDTNKSVSGVVQGHAYTLLGVCNLDFEGQTHKLVQLRNPWGKGEATTEWSDSDPRWSRVSSAEKTRIGWTGEADDGSFFMTWQEFCRQFRAVTIAQINDNASYVYESAIDKENKGCYFTIEIHKECTYSFQVDKTPERIFPDAIQSQYQHPNAVFQIFSTDGKKIGQEQSKRRTLFCPVPLKPGKYIARVLIDFNPQFEKDFDVNLASYAEYPCKMSRSTKEEAAVVGGASWNPDPSIHTKKEWNGQGNPDEIEKIKNLLTGVAGLLGIKCDCSIM